MTTTSITAAPAGGGGRARREGTRRGTAFAPSVANGANCMIWAHGPMKASVWLPLKTRALMRAAQAKMPGFPCARNSFLARSFGMALS